MKSLVVSVEKAFMVLRYNSIVQRNVRLMQKKQRSSLIDRSFNGWKYHIIEDKATRYFDGIRKKRDLQFYFSHWLDS